MVDSLVLPLSGLVEQIHFFGGLVGINHVQVQACVLLHPAEPRGGPVVVLCDGDHCVDWKIYLLNAVKLKGV